MTSYMAPFSFAIDSSHLGSTRHTYTSADIPQSHHQLRSQPAHYDRQDSCSGPKQCAAREFCRQPQRDDTRSGHLPRDAGHSTCNGPYPSPPLTASALRSTKPLPDACGETHTDYFMREISGERAEQSMSHEPLPLHAPLSPPPTCLRETRELPRTDLTAASMPLDHDDNSASCSYHREVGGHNSIWSRRCHPGIDDGPGMIDDSDRASSSYPFSPGQPTEGWDYQGNLSGLQSITENTARETCPPPRRDSGFEESLPQLKPSGQSLGSLSEEVDPNFCKMETSYWADHSPVSVHRHLLSDDPSHFNSAVTSEEYSSESHFVPPYQYSPRDSTPSWRSTAWSSEGERDSDFSPPASPRPGSLRLDLPGLDECPRHNSLGFNTPDTNNDLPSLYGNHISYTQPPTLWMSEAVHDHEDMTDDSIPMADMMNIDCEISPTSPRPVEAFLPPAEEEANGAYAGIAIPHRANTWPQPLDLRPQGLLDSPSLFNDDMCITPIPRSPHSRFAAFLDSNEDGTLSPSSPSVALPPSSDDFAPPSTEEYILSGTVAPSLITPPSIDDEGLGLCLQPHSADLPLARSPSPDDDGFQFLEVQLDPASCNLEVGEFLQLRLLRRRALSAERDARRAEAQYGKQVNEAAEKLNMPVRPSGTASASDGASCDAEEAGSDTTAVAEESEMNLGSDADDCMSDDDAARAWRHKLHCAMDMRAEARRVRKREKQRSKEVGALLDLKMARGPAPGRGAMRSLAQLVANMVLRRRDTFRPLANRKPGTPTPTHVPSSLSRCVSAEDLIEWVDMMEVEDDVACDA